jgi:metal-sulfur cluster biosynthetic enzyme
MTDTVRASSPDDVSTSDEVPAPDGISASDGFSAAEPDWKSDLAADAVSEAERQAAVDAGAAPAATGPIETGSPALPLPVSITPAPVAKASMADIEEAMKDVVDPELGINVVDLGLVYGTHVDDENVATLDMTLTSAACPLTDVIEEQTRAALTTGPGGGLVSDFRINWVWLPPWGPDKITEDGREQLRALGFNV